MNPKKAKVVDLEVERLKVAILYLAACIEEGSWQGVAKDVYDLLKPTKKS